MRKYLGRLFIVLLLLLLFLCVLQDVPQEWESHPLSIVKVEKVDDMAIRLP